MMSPSSKKSIKSQRTEVEKTRALIAGNIGRTKGDQENARRLESSVHDAGEETISRNVAKPSKKLRPQAQVGEQKFDTSSDSSDEESTCMLQEVNPMGQSDNRPLKTVLIGGVGVKVLPDSGATVNAMDETTFKKYGLDKRVKIRKSRCQIKPYGAAAEANTLPVLGCFEALTESKTKMKVVTWQLIKGDTQTTPLLSYRDGRDLGMIRVTNAIVKEGN